MRRGRHSEGFLCGRIGRGRPVGVGRLWEISFRDHCRWRVHNLVLHRIARRGGGLEFDVGGSRYHVCRLIAVFLCSESSIVSTVPRQHARIVCLCHRCRRRSRSVGAKKVCGLMRRCRSDAAAGPLAHVLLRGSVSVGVTVLAVGQRGQMGIAIRKVASLDGQVAVGQV